MREQNESGTENVEDTGTTRPALEGAIERGKGDCNPATEIQKQVVRPLGDCARGAMGERGGKVSTSLCQQQ